MAISSKISTPTNPSTQAVSCLPPLGQIPLNPAKVGGCHEQDLVHGNVIRTINGDSTYKLCKSGPEGAGNSYLAIEGDEHHITNGNLDNYVVGKTIDTRVGVYNQTNISPRNDVFMHTRAEIHHEPENRQQLTQDISMASTVIEFCETQWEKHDYKISAYLAAVNLNVMSADARLYALRNYIFRTEKTSIDVKMSEITGSLGGLATEIKELKLKAAGSHIKAIAGNINAGIALNSDSPFG
ncbi:MAG: hypothetical protein ABR907_15855 [Terracidiphilus sp.]|jgi:hypothetical protein